MAAVSATCVVQFATYVHLSHNQLQKIGTSSNIVSWGRRGRMGGFPLIRTLPLQICAAKAETVQQVSEIVRKQLALAPEVQVTPDSTFAELGADSLDTVEIVMGLEEAFEITVEEENSDNITTIKDAADLIDKLIEKKGSSS